MDPRCPMPAMGGMLDDKSVGSISDEQVHIPACYSPSFFGMSSVLFGGDSLFSPGRSTASPSADDPGVDELVSWAELRNVFDVAAHADVIDEGLAPPATTTTTGEPELGDTVRDTPGRAPPICSRTKYPVWHLQTKYETWKDVVLLNLSSEDRESGWMPHQLSPSAFSTNCPYFQHCSTEFLIAGDKSFCSAIVGRAPDSQSLIVLDPKTSKFRQLPPLNYPRHPLLMNIVADNRGRGHYIILVSGSAFTASDDNLSRKTELYDSATGKWECCADIPDTGNFSLNEYQTGVYHRDSEGRELLCCVVGHDAGANGDTKAVFMYDFKEEHPVHGRGKCENIPPLKGASRVVNAEIVECGGCIFLFSLQETNLGDALLGIHKLDPDKYDSGDMWEDVVEWKKTGGREKLVYPKFTCEPLSAKVVEIDGSVVVFSEQVAENEEKAKGKRNANLEKEKGKKKVIICIDKLKLDGSGGGTWERTKQFKKKRRRGRNWDGNQATAFLKAREEALTLKEMGKDHWEQVSQVLWKKYGVRKAARECEDKWGTLLKCFTKRQEILESKNIRPDDETGAWEDFCSSTQNKRALEVFSHECYQIMNRIEGIKPRTPKSGGTKHKLPRTVRETGTAGASTSSLLVTEPTITSSIVQAANSTPAGARLSTTSFNHDNSTSTRGHGDHQLAAKFSRPSGGSLVSEGSDHRLFDLSFLQNGDPNSTNEQITRVREEELNLEKLKVSLEIERTKLQILLEKNRRRRGRSSDCADQRPQKSRRTAN